jgi:hypothetical protein
MTAEPVGVLDILVARVLELYPYRFTVPDTPEECEIAYRIRYQAVVDEGRSRSRRSDVPGRGLPSSPAESLFWVPAL